MLGTRLPGRSAGGHIRPPTQKNLARKGYALDSGLAVLARVRSLDIVDAIVVLLLVAVLFAWVGGIFHRMFDHDELEHAHVSWLIRSGLRPFYDFFECHPPFLWYPLSLAPRILGETYQVLFGYRMLTALGHVLVFVGIAKNLSLSFRRLPNPVALSARTAGLAVAMIAGNPAILDYLLEFRLDAWPNALLIFSIYRFRKDQADHREVFMSSAQFAALATAATLCSPKLVVLLAIFVAATVAVADRKILRFAGLAAGGLAGLSGGVLLLLAMRLNPVDVYHLAITYHQLLDKYGGFGHGLAEAVWAQPTPSAIVAVSVVSWLLLVRRKLLSSSFEIAVCGFLVLQLILVTFRYKQYYGPWFVLGVTFVPYLDSLLRRIRFVHSVAVAIAILYIGANALDGYREFHRTNQAAADIEFRKLEETLIPPGGTVAAAMDRAPLFRRSVFFHVSTSFAPSGYDTGKIMRTLAVKSLGDRFAEPYYDQELESHRPNLIVPDGCFTPAQRASIDRYLNKNRSAYRQQDSRYGPIFALAH